MLTVFGRFLEAAQLAMDFLIRKVSSDMLFVGKGREGEGSA